MSDFLGYFQAAHEWVRDASDSVNKALAVRDVEIAKLRETVARYVAKEQAAYARRSEILLDPESVYTGMKLGVIAKPTVAQIKEIYGADL